MSEKEIIKELSDIKKELHEIKEILSNLKKSTNKMDDHILFIEDTYSTLRSPLDWITKNVNRISGYSSETELPLINNKK